MCKGNLKQNANVGIILYYNVLKWLISCDVLLKSKSSVECKYQFLSKNMFLDFQPLSFKLEIEEKHNGSQKLNLNKTCDEHHPCLISLYFHYNTKCHRRKLKTTRKYNSSLEFCAPKAVKALKSNGKFSL